jgi:hypothetical protein
VGWIPEAGSGRFAEAADVVDVSARTTHTRALGGGS